MQNTATADPAVNSAAKGDSKVNGGAEFMYRVAEKFGLPVAILALVLWWARNDMVQPLLDAHFQVINQIVDGQRDHAERLDSIGSKLDELISVSRQK